MLTNLPLDLQRIFCLCVFWSWGCVPPGWFKMFTSFLSRGFTAVYFALDREMLCHGCNSILYASLHEMKIQHALEWRWSFYSKTQSVKIYLISMKWLELFGRLVFPKWPLLFLLRKQELWFPLVQGQPFFFFLLPSPSPSCSPSPCARRSPLFLEIYFLKIYYFKLDT